MARTVLVVDDEPDVLEVVASMAEELGCNVVTANDAFDALSLLEANPHIEIMISDINMPGINGYELAHRGKAIRQNLGVILLSGRESSGGGYPLMRKPFHIADLKRIMANTTGLC